MINVLTIGCFDLLHKGHILHLVKARFEISKKLLIQDKQIYLIAAYASQERIKKRKPKYFYYTNEEKRKRELESTGLVQKTIIQGGTFTIPLILKKLKKEKKIQINYLVLGYDQSLHFSFIDLCREIKNDIELSKINIFILDNREFDFISDYKPSTTLIYRELNGVKDAKIIKKIRKNVNQKCLISFKNSYILTEFFSVNNFKQNKRIISIFEDRFFLCIHSHSSFKYILNKCNLHNSKNFIKYNNHIYKRSKSI